MAGILAPLPGLTPTQTGPWFLFAVLAPAVLNFMVAEQCRPEPGKVASIILVGNVPSVVRVPIGLATALRP